MLYVWMVWLFTYRKLVLKPFANLLFLPSPMFNLLKNAPNKLKAKRKRKRRTKVNYLLLCLFLILLRNDYTHCRMSMILDGRKRGSRFLSRTLWISRNDCFSLASWVDFQLVCFLKFLWIRFLIILDIYSRPCSQNAIGFRSAVPRFSPAGSTALNKIAICCKSFVDECHLALLLAVTDNEQYWYSLLLCYILLHMNIRVWLKIVQAVRIIMNMHYWCNQQYLSDQRQPYHNGIRINSYEVISG